MSYSLQTRSRDEGPDTGSTAGAFPVVQTCPSDLAGMYEMQSPEHIRQRFTQLVARWKQDTVLDSSLTDIVNHPAYREIVGIGWPVVPLILEEMDREPDHWSYALWEITGENPVDPEDEGNLATMARAWRLWGQRRKV